jgi:excisionase family DNA binding protein
MRTAMSNAGRPAFYTAEQAAWILGVSTDRIYRAIRTGTLPAIWRRSRRLVPATALTQLLAEATQDAGAPRAELRTQSGGAA